MAFGNVLSVGRVFERLAYSAFFDCRVLFDKGYTVFFVHHGDGSKFAMPEIVDDCRRAVRYIRFVASKYNVDPDRLGELGASAGGHLALMLASTSDEGVPNPPNSTGDTRLSDRVAAAVAYFPPTDIRTWWENGNAKHYGEAFNFDPKLAADYSPALQVTRFTAPSLMIHGEKDTAVPLWHSEEFLEACRKTTSAAS